MGGRLGWEGRVEGDRAHVRIPVEGPPATGGAARGTLRAAAIRGGVGGGWTLVSCELAVDGAPGVDAGWGLGVAAAVDVLPRPAGTPGPTPASGVGDPHAHAHHQPARV